MSERPLQAHQPVRPGFTLLYRGRPPCSSSSPGMRGRGPMMDMSPATTLKNWGSSSSDVWRRMRPTGVMRGSSNGWGVSLPEFGQRSRPPEPRRRIPPSSSKRLSPLVWRLLDLYFATILPFAEFDIIYNCQVSTNWVMA